MIIYVSVGLGKTTYCKMHSNCCDADYYNYLHSNYSTYKEYVLEMSKLYDIVFINHVDGIDLIDQVYLADNFDMIVERVTKRENNKFIPNKDVFIEEHKLFPNAVILKDNQYLSDVFKEEDYYVTNY